MRDITLGQYYPSNGILHRLDPRIKVLLLTGTIVLIFCTFNFFALGVAALLVATSVILSKVPIKLYLKSMKAIIIVILITSLLNLFYGTGDPLWSFWIFKVTKDGIENSIYVTVRIISLVMVSSSLTFVINSTLETAAILDRASPRNPRL